LKLEKPRLPVSYVDSAASLDALILAITGLDSIALDAERASGFRYSQRAYLIQLATKEEIFLVDPLALDESVPGWTATLGATLSKATWLLHAATQDLPCLAELDIRPTKLIDTELAARLAGYERVGLGSLTLELLEIELAKEHSAADWSARPLTEEMLDYAALDVDVMDELWVKIEQSLIEQGKLDWALEEFTNLVSFKPKQIPAEPWRNLPGLSKIKEVPKLKIAASLWLARDQIARDRDSAPGRLIPDRSIMAAVVQQPKSKSDLASNKEFQGRASRTLLNVWWDAIAKADQVEIDPNPAKNGNGIPSHRSWEKRFPDAHARLEAVRPLLVERATELKLPIENLLTPDLLRRVCFEPAEDISSQLKVLGARSWQIQQAADLIKSGLEKAQTPPAA
jgi:ribonuclease D